MNQFTNVGGQAIVYDNDFNVASYNGATFTYDAENRLVGGSMQAIYDGLGRWVKRTINGVTRFITYDDWNPLYEWDASGNAVGANIYGAKADELIGRWDSSLGILFYKQDKEGNVMTVLNQGGAIVENYRYDAFGAPKVTDGAGNAVEYADHTPKSAVGNRFMYTGREYIQELGIYDYRHRVYHPGLGRSLQTDPTGFAAGDMNLYRYCDDDPVDRTDPTGLYVVRAIDWDPGLHNGLSRSQTGEAGDGTAWTTGVPNARERAESQSLTMALIQTRDGQSRNDSEKVLDKEQLSGAIMASHKIANALLGQSQSDSPYGREWSTEVMQKGREFRTTLFRKGEDKVHEGGTNRYGSYVHWDDVPKGWTLIAHVYTQKQYTEHVLPHDVPKFNKLQIEESSSHHTDRIRRNTGYLCTTQTFGNEMSRIISLCAGAHPYFA
jgi:RHS repeat-associated protein